MIGSPRKKKNGRIRNQRVRILLVLLVIAVVMIIGKLLIFGLVMSDDFLSDSTYLSGTDAVAVIEQTLGVTVPESADNFTYYYTAWLDYYMRIRIDMSPDDAPIFLQQMSITCLQSPLQDNLMPFRTVEGDDDWWQPYSAEVYSGVEQCGDNPYWSLVVDQTNPDMWIVYIESFST